MQKDTVLTSIATVSQNPDNINKVVGTDDINSVVVNGKELGVGGYLDMGLYDTMKDLFVNFTGAVVFGVIGYFFAKSRGKQRFALHFIPKKIRKDREENYEDIKK